MPSYPADGLQHIKIISFGIIGWISLLQAQPWVAMQTCGNSPHLRKLRKCLCKYVWTVRPSASVRLSDQGTFISKGIISKRESNKKTHRDTKLKNRNGYHDKEGNFNHQLMGHSLGDSEHGLYN